MKIRLKLVLFCSSVLLSLIFAEAFFRTFLPQKTFNTIRMRLTSDCFKKGTYNWLAMRENTTCLIESHIASPDLKTSEAQRTEIRTNSLGLRGQDISVNKKEGAKRLLFVGDSFTLGFTVPEHLAFPEQTASLLNSRSLSFQFEAVNAGMIASGLDYYYLYLKKNGLALTPDVIVVGVYLDNDITYDMVNTTWPKRNEENLPETIESEFLFAGPSGTLVDKRVPAWYRIPILRNSHLFSYIMTRVFPKSTTTLSAETVDPLVCFHTPGCRSLDPEIERSKKLLLAMKALADSNNAELLVVLIPVEFQINGAFQKYGIASPLTPSQLRHPHDMFTTFFRENRINVIDLLEPLQAASGTFYHELDNHWNQHGQTLAAQTIAPVIESLVIDSSESSDVERE